jgi:predicted PurR-regulated permease PerM
VLLLIVPVLVKEMPLLKAQLPLLLDRLDQTVNAVAGAVRHPLGARRGQHQGLAGGPAGRQHGGLAQAGAGSARIGGSVLLSLLGNAMLVPVVLFYLLIDWPQLVRAGAGPGAAAGARCGRSFFGDCDAVLGQYLRGQLLVMVVLAAYYAIALALVGFDLALPMGVFTGLAVAIPYVGFGLGLALALLAALLQFASLGGVLLVVAVYGLGQLLESFVLTPRLVGERIGLGPWP